jgi:hypothetical protein
VEFRDQQQADFNYYVENTEELPVAYSHQEREW